VTTIQKIALALVGVSLATTLVLPNRITPQVLRAGGDVLTGALKTSQGR
jgi:hypothetical protein